MYRAAMRSVLSELLRQERLLLVETFAIETPKTKTAIARLNELGVERGLIVVEAFDENLWLATRNLPNIFCLDATELDPLSLVGSDKVIMTTAAARLIEERLG
jgi:large subunit ribosomal protein L4